MELPVSEIAIFSDKLSKSNKFHSSVNEAESNINENENDKNNLHDSGFSLESRKDEFAEGLGWFGGIGSDLLNCLTENVSPVVSGVATLVHKTAIAVANEISQLECDGELTNESIVTGQSIEDCVQGDDLFADFNVTYSSLSHDPSTRTKSHDLLLPWEIRQNSSYNLSVKEDDDISVYFTDTELMKKMFALSTQESTFLEPFSDESFDGDESKKHLPSSSYSSTFIMDVPRVNLIHRILDIDENLASIHFELTEGVPKLSKTSFWKNYFFHCERVKADELCRRKKQNQTRETQIKPPCKTTMATFVRSSPMQEHSEMKFIKTNDDDESLIPVGSDIEGELDDDSFVIQSPPNTGNTFTTSVSIDDDIVLVDTYQRIARGKL
mmetsp:Transcript_7001/g.17113  ORF Transcript_7001/g.17113 Transcript_7001/m.17113 type:complete len:382 (-) Transcript_7001:2460-3605(-)